MWHRTGPGPVSRPTLTHRSRAHAATMRLYVRRAGAGAAGADAAGAGVAGWSRERRCDQALIGDGGYLHKKVI